MLRDRVAAAVSAPLTLVATRPDGLEVARMTVAGASLAAGTATWSLPLSRTAPHGRWQIAAYIDPKADPVGRVQFDVADFVPQKLKVTLTAQETVLHANTDFHVKAEARFLYGAPAGGLSGDGVAKVTIDPAPFAGYEDWQFGRIDDTFADVSVNVTVPDTDPTGVTVATGSIGDLPDTTLAAQSRDHGLDPRAGRSRHGQGRRDSGAHPRRRHRHSSDVPGRLGRRERAREFRSRRAR